MTNIHKTVVCVIRNSNNELLLIRSPKWKDYWVFAGGHIEKNESIEQAAIREAKEETGLDTTVVAILGSAVESSPPEFYKPINVHYSAILLDGSNQEVHPDPVEVSGYKWINVEQLNHVNIAGYVRIVQTWLAEGNHA